MKICIQSDVLNSKIMYTKTVRLTFIEAGIDIADIIPTEPRFGGDPVDLKPWNTHGFLSSVIMPILLSTPLEAIVPKVAAASYGLV